MLSGSHVRRATRRTQWNPKSFSVSRLTAECKRAGVVGKRYVPTLSGILVSRSTRSNFSFLEKCQEKSNKMTPRLLREGARPKGRVFFAKLVHR